GAGVGRDPVVDGPWRDAEAVGDRNDGLAAADFQESQGTAVQADVVGTSELPLEATSLPSGQDDGVHGSPPSYRRVARRTPCEKTSAGLLRSANLSGSVSPAIKARRMSWPDSSR